LTAISASNKRLPASEYPSSGWRRFFRLTAIGAIVPMLVLFSFVATIDPWDALLFSPKLPRVPVTTSARYSFPMLARRAQVDSVVIGTSTSRLLRPEVLDPLFKARFVNLSINAATAYEETRLLDVFVAAHARPRFILLGLDLDWCDARPESRYTEYPFPEWLYDAPGWNGYTQLLNLYAIQESGSQLWAMAGLKPARYPPDGYTDFRVPEDQYNVARAHEHIVAAGTAPGPLDLNAPEADYVFSTHRRLKSALAMMPEHARKILFFVPFILPYQGAEGSATRAYWAECKRRVVTMARVARNVTVLDFMISSPITREESNYYDAIHYRPEVADRVAADLASVTAGVTPQNEDFKVLSE
jgi:hypothetical protein